MHLVPCYLRIAEHDNDNENLITTFLLLVFAILTRAGGPGPLPTAGELREECKIVNSNPSTYSSLSDSMKAGQCLGYIAAWMEMIAGFTIPGRTAGMP
jgi:hypothetical protein